MAENLFMRNKRLKFMQWNSIYFFTDFFMSHAVCTVCTYEQYDLNKIKKTQLSIT